MEIPIIETPHLILRAWTRQEATVLFEILQEDGVLRYFPDPRPPALSKVKDYISHQLAHWEIYDYGHWAIMDREAGQALGWVGLEYLPELRETEVGYLLRKRVWGRGYATEAARAAVGYGFDVASLPSIIGLVHPDNTGSIRVLAKCGMTFVDRLALWGLDMSRYRVDRAAHEQGSVRQAIQPGITG